jgi:hypothetical protein
MLPRRPIQLDPQSFLALARDRDALLSPLASRCPFHLCFLRDSTRF